MEKKNSKFKKNTIFSNDVRLYSGLLQFKDKITQMSANYLILNENLFMDSQEWPSKSPFVLECFGCAPWQGEVHAVVRNIFQRSPTFRLKHLNIGFSSIGHE